MKRKEFVRKLEELGCLLHRHGARHDIYINPHTALRQPVPRHAEIHDRLCRHILKYLGLEVDE